MNTNDIIEKCAEIAESLYTPETIARHCAGVEIALRIRALKSTLPVETVSDAMVEAAARKLCEMDGVDPDYLCHTDEQPVGSRYRGDQLSWRAWEKEARAAIEAAALAPADDGWQPIETAPRDGTWILLAGPSGHSTTPLRVEVCRWYPKYRPRNSWQNHSNDAFTDGGKSPTHWRPLPAPPVGDR